MRQESYTLLFSLTLKERIRMFKVFISSKSLERLCLEEMSKDKEGQSAWFLVLSMQNTIYLDKDVYSEWEYGDPLFTFSESYGVDLKKSDIDFECMANPSYEPFPFEPQGTYLLDVSEDTANTIQNDYGIICQSTDDLTKCPLSESERRFSLRKDEEGHSWKDILSCEPTIPSNAIVIIDRYLFAYDHSNVGFKNAISNIKDIMRCVLPTQLKTDYHIIILYDEGNSGDRNYDIDTLAREFEKYKGTLKRPYNIVIEFMSIPKGYKGYEVTHHRKIISNYFIVSADQHIKAFRGRQATATQDVRCEYAYSAGLRNVSDPPIKTIETTLSSIHNMIEDGGKDREQEGFVYDTTKGVKQNISEVVNRLVV